MTWTEQCLITVRRVPGCPDMTLLNASLMPPTLILAAWLSALILSVVAVRILVDDANPAWVYEPSETDWNAITPAHPCTKCDTQPDPTRALNGTWHDTAFPERTAQLLFTGIAIEVYTICPEPLSAGGLYGTNFTFTLDNFPDGDFIGPLPSCTKFTYNYLVYSRSNLSLSRHNFTITNNAIDSRANSSNLLLDYAIYDNGNSTPPVSSPSSSTTKSRSSFPLFSVIVPVAVAVLLILTNIFLFWFYRSRSGKSRAINGFDPTNDSIMSSFAVDRNIHLGPRGYTGAPVIMPGSVENEDTAGEVADNPGISAPESLNAVQFAPIPSTLRDREPENVASASIEYDPRPTSTSAIESTTASSPEPQATWAPDTKVPSTTNPDWLPPGYKGYGQL